MLTDIVIPLVAGGLLLIAGGEALVRGAVALALRWRLPQAVIGVTLVGFGTSTPELLSSVEAALAGSAPIAIANAVGSNTANILLILGAAALVSPFAIPRAETRRDLAWVVGAALLLAGLLVLGGVPRWAGLGLLALLAVHAWQSLTTAGDTQADLPATPRGAAWTGWALAIGGLAAALVGAGLFVDGAVRLAAASGLSEAVIGATVVAVGTSLPELALSLTAARRGAGGIALGNVLGSNLFNILGVLGATAVLAPLPAPAEILARDLWAMLGATAILLALALGPGRVGRGGGVALLALYAGYLALMLAA